jgi:hypothetical protein
MQVEGVCSLKRARGGPAHWPILACVPPQQWVWWPEAANREARVFSPYCETRLPAKKIGNRESEHSGSRTAPRVRDHQQVGM